MKNRKFKSWFPAVALSMVVGMIGLSNADADLLTYFNFNEQTTGAASAATLTSDAPGKQTTTITSNFAIPATNVVVFAGSALNKAPGDTTTGGTGAISFLAGALSGGIYANNGKYFQLEFSNQDFTDLVLSYATQRTGTGFTSQTLSYSVDKTNFTTFSSNTAIPAAFGVTTFDLTGVTALYNQPDVIFRLTLDGATSASGNNRFDNIQINAVPEPTTLLGGVALLGLIAMRERRRFGSWKKLGLFDAPGVQK